MFLSACTDARDLFSITYNNLLYMEVVRENILSTYRLIPCIYQVYMLIYLHLVINTTMQSKLL